MCIDAGMFRIRDIIDENGNFLSFEQITVKFVSCIFWLTYKILISAVLVNWMAMLKDTDTTLIPIQEQNYDKLLQFRSASSIVYYSIIGDKSQIEPVLEKWNALLDTEILRGFS